MDLRQVREEWEREQNWAPVAREPGSQMEDDTEIPLLRFASKGDGKWSRGILYDWETETSWHPPIETLSIHEIVQRSATGLNKQLEQIQKYRIKRDGIIDWASNLRFIIGPEPGVGVDQTILPRSTKQMCTCTCSWEESAERGKDLTPACCSCANAASPISLDSKMFRLIQSTPGCHHYIAVSYRWLAHNNDSEEVESSQDATAQKAADYLSTIINRAVKFSLHHGYQLLWIDQKCINQNDVADKTIGVQAMDIVYENASLCLAVLNVEITSQEQISALAKAMDVSMHPVNDEEKWFEWIEHLDHRELHQMAKVIKMIAEDEYFSRAWITQENTAASATVLLIRYDPCLICPDSLGNLEGEVQLPLCEFQLACDKLAGAFAGAIVEEIRYYENKIARYGGDGTFRDETSLFSSRHLHKRQTALAQYQSAVRPYFQWQAYFELFLSKNEKGAVRRRHQGRHHCSAAQAVELLSTKKNDEISDRLAIIANLCNYEVRSDSQKLKELGYNLAVSVFCLSILNGDLSLARMPDGIIYKDLGVQELSMEHFALQFSHGRHALDRLVDMEIGPPSFSWAPRLAEGFTERPRLRKDSKRYALEFLGSESRVHIYGWLWHWHEHLIFPELAETFKKRLSNDMDETKHSTDFKTKWHMTISNQFECFWDIIQTLRNRQLFTVAKDLCISLSKCSMELLGPLKLGTSSNILDLTDDEELRHAIHTISLEEFKDLIPLASDTAQDLPMPQYWMVQRIVMGDTTDLFKLDDTHMNPSTPTDTVHVPSTSAPTYALFNSWSLKHLFTPFVRETDSKTPLDAVLYVHRVLSWPVSVTACSDAAPGICIKVDRAGFKKGSPFSQIGRIGNFEEIPKRPYLLL